MGALFGALLMGATLGLLGAGGAILTVPLLVFLLGHGEKQAIAEALGIVASIAIAGALRMGRAGNVEWKTALLFGIPGMGGAIVGAHGSQWLTGPAQLVLLSGIMFVAAGAMLRRAPDAPITQVPGSEWKTAIFGFLIGIATGLLGVGGGFLIVPALVLLRGMEMKRAVGTSLAVIAMNSTVGFLKHLLGPPVLVDWMVVATFAGVGIIGSLLGAAIATRINALLLRRIFAGFLVLLALFIIVQHAPALWRGP